MSQLTNSNGLIQIHGCTGIGLHTIFIQIYLKFYMLCDFFRWTHCNNKCTSFEKEFFFLKILDDKQRNALQNFDTHSRFVYIKDDNGTKVKTLEKINITFNMVLFSIKFTYIYYCRL